MRFDWKCWFHIAEQIFSEVSKRYEGLPASRYLWDALSCHDAQTNGCSGPLADLRDAETEYLKKETKPGGERWDSYKDWLESSIYKDCDKVRELYVERETEFMWNQHAASKGECQYSLPLYFDGSIDSPENDIQVADATGYVKFSKRDLAQLKRADPTKEIDMPGKRKLNAYTFWRRVCIARQLIPKLETIGAEEDTEVVPVGAVVGLCQQCFAPFDENDVSMGDALTVKIFECPRCSTVTGYRCAVALKHYLFNPGKYNYRWLCENKVVPDARQKLPHETGYPELYPVLLTEPYHKAKEISSRLRRRLYYAEKENSSGFSLTGLRYSDPGSLGEPVSASWIGLPGDKDASISVAFFDTGLIVAGPVATEGGAREPKAEEVSFMRDVLLELGYEERRSCGRLTPVWEGLLTHG